LEDLFDRTEWDGRSIEVRYDDEKRAHGGGGRRETSSYRDRETYQSRDTYRSRDDDYRNGREEYRREEEYRSRRDEEFGHGHGYERYDSTAGETRHLVG
jgi:hypothetical protein